MMARYMKYWVDNSLLSMKKPIFLALLVIPLIFCSIETTANNIPIRDPIYTAPSPALFENRDGKIVFKEFFDGLRITAIQFIDPDSNEILLEVSLSERGEIESKSSSVNPKVEKTDKYGPLISEFDYKSRNGNIYLSITDVDGQLSSYSLFEKVEINYKKRTPKEFGVKRHIMLEQGVISYENSEIMKEGKRIKNTSRSSDKNRYTETFFLDDGDQIYKVFEDGFLIEEKTWDIKNKLDSKKAFYLNGLLGFLWKHEVIEGNHEYLVYDKDSKLISRLKSRFCELFSFNRKAIEEYPAIEFAVFKQNKNIFRQAVVYDGNGLINTQLALEDLDTSSMQKASSAQEPNVYKETFSFMTKYLMMSANSEYYKDVEELPLYPGIASEELLYKGTHGKITLYTTEDFIEKVYDFYAKGLGKEYELHKPLGGGFYFNINKITLDHYRHNSTNYDASNFSLTENDVTTKQFPWRFVFIQCNRWTGKTEILVSNLVTNGTLKIKQKGIKDNPKMPFTITEPPDKWVFEYR